ncbi:zf-HC2 domain-containing protein [Catenulispora yoronensis]|uniref:Zf-HC2 domain-containing protein n=1 Tax=Catenulispora yoronensis TaxID=450799 RepID=A0ABN2V1F9_9ACTN
MDCDEFVELVTAFLDGALPADDEERFVAHLTECDGCETYLEQFRQTVDTLGGLPADALSADALSGPVRTRLLEAFRDRNQR